MSFDHRHRLPKQGFIDFNRVYVGTLERWGIFKDDENPVARSNVCPEIGAPPEPSFEAFSYTVPAPETDTPSFVIAGSGEAPEGPGDYSERIIRLGDTSPDAMREKAQYVLGAMEARMAALGVGWADVGATQVLYGGEHPRLPCRGNHPPGRRTCGCHLVLRTPPGAGGWTMKWTCAGCRCNA